MPLVKKVAHDAHQHGIARLLGNEQMKLPVELNRLAPGIDIHLHCVNRCAQLGKPFRRHARTSRDDHAAFDQFARLHDFKRTLADGSAM